MSNLKNTSSATKWVLGGMVFKQIMRLFSNLIMTRVLSVEAFGIMAIINLALQAVNMMSDVGIRQSVIKSPRTDDVFLRTAWTVQVLRGLFLWLLTCLLAWPISAFYEEPILLYILPCSGLIPLFVGFQSIVVLQNQKELNYKRLVILEVIAALAGLAVMVASGIYYESVWALVLGGVLSVFLMLVFGHVFLRKIKHAFCWNKEVIHELFHFGKWVFISTALTFFVGQYDKISLGKLANMHTLGLYSIAMVWSSLPVMIVGQINNKVFFPVVSELYRKGQKEKICAIRNSLIKLSVVISLFMIAIGQVLINVLYNSEYKEAGGVLSVLAILSLFQIIEAINTNLLMTVGRPKDKVVSQIIGLGIFILFLPAAFSEFGMIGVAFLAVISMMIRAYILDLKLRKDGLYFLAFDLKITVILFFIGFVAHMGLKSVVTLLPDVVLLTISTILVLLALIVVYLRQFSLRKLMNA